MNPQNVVPHGLPMLLKTDPGSAEILAELAEHVAELVAVVDSPGLKLRYLNPAGRELLGFGLTEELRGMDWTDCLPTRSVSTLLYEIVPLLQKGGRWQGEASLWRRTVGLERPVEMWAISLPPDAEGKSLLLFSATDSTERRYLAASLDYEQQLIRSLLDGVPDNIYFKDLSSRFIRVSKHMATWVGVAHPAEMEGKTDFDFFSSDHAQKAYDDEQRILRTGEPLIDMEEMETWPDGRITWVSSSKMPLRDQQGEVMGTFGISRDITARKEAEQQLRATQKELLEISHKAGMVEVTSGVLHNIGLSLDSVGTGLNRLAEQLEDFHSASLGKVAQLLGQQAGHLPEFFAHDPHGQQLPSYLQALARTLAAEHQAMQTEVDLLRRNLENIREISLLQQNYVQEPQVVEEVAPSALMEEALRICEISLARQHIAICRDFAEVPALRVSRHRVLQILVRLIRNAIDAMEEVTRPGQDIVLRLCLGPAGGVQFIVRDVGKGLGPEDLPKVFGFGFALHRHGPDFGLHASANTAKELGGTLRCESEGQGKGMAFILELPATRPPEN